MSADVQTIYPPRKAQAGASSWYSPVNIAAPPWRCSRSAAGGRHCPTLGFGSSPSTRFEFYLNAYLFATGHSPTAVRRLQHDLASRSQCAALAKLVLRKRTLSHLAGLSERREYLMTRYDCTQTGTSELNRLAASLAEIPEKVSARVRAPKASPT